MAKGFQLCLRVPDEQGEEIREVARISGESVSQYVRKAVLARMQTVVVDVSRFTVEGLERVVAGEDPLEVAASEGCADESMRIRAQAALRLRQRKGR